MYDGSARRPERTIVSAQGCHGARRAAMWSERAWSGSCAGTLARAFPCEHGPSALDAEPTRRRRVWKVAEPASDPQAGAFEDHDRVARKSVLAHAGQ